MKNVDELVAKEQLLMDLEYELIKNFIRIRKGNMTQEELAEETKVVRQTINRIEKGLTSPQLSTMLKLLIPLGFTLKIVPIKEREEITWEHF